MRFLSAAVAAAVLVSACDPRPADDAAFGQKVRAYLLANPEVLEEALTRLQAERTAAAEVAVRKSLVSSRSELLSDPRDPVIGDPKAPITVVEFFDYRCGYCKAVAPSILSLVEKNRDVRVVMKEMPILSPESERAARVALLAARQGKYAPVHRALMAERALDEAAVDQIAQSNGVKLSDLQSPALTDHIGAVQRLAASLQVNGTPAFVVGDQIIAGADMAAVQRAIDAQRRKG